MVVLQHIIYKNSCGMRMTLSYEDVRHLPIPLRGTEHRWTCRRKIAGCEVVLRDINSPKSRSKASASFSSAASAVLRRSSNAHSSIWGMLPLMSSGARASSASNQMVGSSLPSSEAWPRFSPALPAVNDRLVLI